MREAGRQTWTTATREGGSAAPAGRAAATDARGTDAAQFMPFAALTGYYELVREQERTEEERRTPGEERAEEISRMIVRLRKGDQVVVTHYLRKSYVTMVGTIREVNEAMRELDLVDGTRILFEDIWELGWA